MRSAVFLPTPGTATRRRTSCRRSASTSSVGRDSREHRQGHAGADAGHAEEEEEERALPLRQEAVEREGVLADVRVDPEGRRALLLRQLVERRERDVDEVADAGHVQEDLVRRLRREAAGEAADHDGDSGGAAEGVELRRPPVSAHEARQQLVVDLDLLLGAHLREVGARQTLGLAGADRLAQLFLLRPAGRRGCPRCGSARGRARIPSGRRRAARPGPAASGRRPRRARVRRRSRGRVRRGRTRSWS